MVQGAFGFSIAASAPGVDFDRVLMAGAGNHCDRGRGESFVAHSGAPVARRMVWAGGHGLRMGGCAVRGFLDLLRLKLVVCAVAEACVSGMEPSVGMRSERREAHEVQRGD